jgi:hypothetical protein
MVSYRPAINGSGYLLDLQATSERMKVKNLLAVPYICLISALGLGWGLHGRAEEKAYRLPFIQVSGDGKHFVSADRQQPFVIWGVNYDHDERGRLLEDYWENEWSKVEEDFGEIRALGANVVRIHLQLSRFMVSAEQPNLANLERLKRLLSLAERLQLYLDVTGLGCYHRADVPGWYDDLGEGERWEVQSRFWQAVATTCRHSPAILCYDLMNEPILAGAKPETDWLAGELGGKFFVQRITLDLRGRTREEVAKQWVEKLTQAIRAIDPRHLITVGVIPWAHVFPGAKPLFYAPDVGSSLDFVSVHFYPKQAEVDKALAALKVYEVGKPLVVEEIFPLSCSLEEADQFIQASQSHADGWISFYWGATIEENEAQGELKGAIVAAWLRYFRDQAAIMTAAASR